MNDMWLKTYSRPARRIAVRVRRYQRRIVGALNLGAEHDVLMRQFALGLLFAAITFGGYWATIGPGGLSAGEPGVVEVATVSTPSDTSTSDSIATSSESAAAAVAPSAAAEPAPAADPQAAPASSAAPSGREKAVQVAEAAPVAPVAAATPTPVARPSFRDDRGLQPVTEAAKAEPKLAAASAVTPAAAASFRDDRPIAAPSFKDQRPIASPVAAVSFRDTRPTSPGTFRDDRPVAAPATPALEPAKNDVAEKQAFEVGYFLEDRSPMVRSTEGTEDEASAPASQVISQVAAPSAPAPADVALPTLVALAPGQLKIDPTAACVAPDVVTEALDGGMMRMRVTAGCQPNEFVQISYGGAEFIRKLNAYGALDYTLDCFAGTSAAVAVRFADGSTKSVPVSAKDLDKVSKIAVVWRTGVNLDLHVFEYAAKLDQSGHYWSKSPSSLVSAQVQGQADGRGHGFLSSLDGDNSLGDKLEVYTFFHNDQQSNGSISLALDNETRGENPAGATCGQGALAEIDFQISILPRQGHVTRQSGVLTRVECGTRLTQDARFNQSAMPGLRIRK